jgi:hypothetical protein
MDQIRKPFTGVGNIIRFNWHFYVFSFLFLCSLLLLNAYLPKKISFFLIFLFILVLTITLVSLLTSFYIYDISGLYKLDWITSNPGYNKIVNINAGFDETSGLLQSKFPHAEMVVLDFYDPLKHTEVSIRRARKAYPAYPNTKTITTSNIPLQPESADAVFLILAAHEIRDNMERAVFFEAIGKVLSKSGKVYVVEHLRDIPNFFAYTIGFCHFLPKSSWLRSFKNADLRITKMEKITPFITLFILDKNGDTA